MMLRVNRHSINRTYRRNYLPSRNVRRSYSSQADELVRYGAEHLAQGTGKLTDILIDRAQGSYVYDKTGRKYLDFSCGIGVTNTGHCHPRVVKAAQEQISKLIHAQISIAYHQPMIDLTKRILAHLPSPIDRIFYTNSGAEAIENAVKIARCATKKPNIVVFENSFHGRTIGTMSLTTSKSIYRAGMGPLMPGVVVAPFPYCYRCPVNNANTSENKAPSRCCGVCEEKFDDILRMQTDPKEVAAILIEPIQGEGGYIPATKSFMQKLRKICTDNNILMIVDEVQSGFLRTGKWWAFEHYDIVPDIVVMAKGIASGFPLSAVAASDAIMKTVPPGAIGGTYSGNAVSCAAAIATMDVFEEENIMDNVVKRGNELVTGLKLLQQNKQYHIGDVRGKGLMVGVEFDRKAPKGVASAVAKLCISNGMLILTAGPHEAIRFIPPLTVSRAEIQEGLKIFQKALDKFYNLA